MSPYCPSPGVTTLTQNLIDREDVQSFSKNSVVQNWAARVIVIGRQRPENKPDDSGVRRESKGSQESTTTSTWPTDEQLLLEFQQGDQAASAAIVERHEVRLARIAYRIVALCEAAPGSCEAAPGSDFGFGFQAKFGFEQCDGFLIF